MVAESGRPMYDQVGTYMAQMTLRIPSPTSSRRVASAKLRLKLRSAALKSKSTSAGDVAEQMLGVGWWSAEGWRSAVAWRLGIAACAGREWRGGLGCAKVSSAVMANRSGVARGVAVVIDCAGRGCIPGR